MPSTDIGVRKSKPQRLNQQVIIKLDDAFSVTQNVRFGKVTRRLVRQCDPDTAGMLNQEKHTRAGSQDILQ